MGRRLGMSVHRLLAVALLFLPAIGAFAACPAPGWWDDPNQGTSELVYEKGSAEFCPTEAAARQKAYENGLAVLRRGVTDNTNLWPRLQLVGADLAFESAARDSLGRWCAWVLVSYPQVQLEKDRKRAEELGAKALERTPVFVCPVSFGRESEEQFPAVVARYRTLGYGNAVWQTVEDLLYGEGFEIVTAPTSRVASLLEQMLGRSTGAGSQTRLPEKLLLCNMNFFEIKTESMSLGAVTRNSEYHVELMLELYDLKNPGGNVKIPAKGEARDKDLLAATQRAAGQAVDKLVVRLRGQ